MFLFTLIILSAYSAFTEAATLDHVRHRRSPSPAQPATKHQDYDHSRSSSYSISFDENQGGVYTQTSDGSLHNQTYNNKNNNLQREQASVQIGNVIETGPNATGKTVHYNKSDSDKESKKRITTAGHKDVIKKPIFVRGPNGKLILSKANETFHQIYNHTKGEESKDEQHKSAGKTVQTVGGVVKAQEHYDHMKEDSINKDFNKNIGEKIVKDQGGNFSNITYNQLAGKQSGSHRDSQKGSQDVAADHQPKPIKN